MSDEADEVEEKGGGSSGDDGGGVNDPLTRCEADPEQNPWQPR